MATKLNRTSKAGTLVTTNTATDMFTVSVNKTTTTKETRTFTRDKLDNQFKVEYSTNPDLAKNVKFGFGFTGDGTVEDPVRVDVDVLNKEYVPLDKVAISIIGDQGLPALPISGSYFSINYPYGTRSLFSAAFTEGNGTLSIITPVTNGIDLRYVYANIPNWTKNRNTPVQNSDIVYKPVDLPEDCYISAVSQASKTAMLVEYSKIEDRSIQGWAFVTLNGTMSFRSHRMTFIPNSIKPAAQSWEDFYDRPPIGFIQNGKQIICKPNDMQGAQGFALDMYQLSKTGSLTKLNNWTVQSRSGSYSYPTSNVVQVSKLAGGKSPTLADGAEVYMLGDVYQVDTIAGLPDGSRGSRTHSLGIGQDGNDVRIYVNRSHSFGSPAGGGLSVAYWSYTFDVTLSTTPSIPNKLVEITSTIGYKPSVNIVNGVLVQDSLPEGYLWNDNASGHSNRTANMTMVDNGYFMANPTNQVSVGAWLRVQQYLNKSAYELADRQTVRGPTANPVRMVDPNKEPPTPVVASSACFFLPRKGPGNIEGMAFSYASGSGAPARPPALSTLRYGSGVSHASYRALSNTVYRGYALNNERITLPKERVGPVLMYKGSAYGSTPQYKDDYFSQAFIHNDNWEEGKFFIGGCDAELKPTKTVELSKFAKDDLENQIKARFPVSTFDVQWRLAIISTNDTGVGTSAVLFLYIYDKSTNGSYTQYGFIWGMSTVITKVNGLDHARIDLLSIFDNGLTIPLQRLSSSGILPETDLVINSSGVAVWRRSQDVFEIIVKEGQRSRTPGGGNWVRRGCYHLTANIANKTTTYIKAFTGLESGESSTIFPSLGPKDSGIGFIDFSVGGGTLFVFSPLEKPPYYDNNQFSNGIFVISPIPSKYFSFVVGSDIPVVLKGIYGTIPEGVYEVSKYVSGDLANKTFYMYVALTDGKVGFIISDEVLIERADRAFVARFTTDDNVIMDIYAVPFSRLGTHRISEVPVGSAVSGTTGAVAESAPRHWLTKWY